MQRSALLSLRWGLVRSSKRLLITEAGLGITQVRADRSNNPNPPSSSLAPALLASAGRGLLLGTDLDRAARGVREVQDLQAFRQLILRYIEMNKDNTVILLQAQWYLQRYHHLCHLLSSGTSSLAMWREEGARLLHTQPTSITPNINLTLLNCLFREGLYKEVLEVYGQLGEVLASQRSKTDHLLLTLALLAICRLNPSSGFPEAKALVENYLRVPQGSEQRKDYVLEGMGRGTFAYAWLALQAGEYAAAHEIVQTRSSKKRLLKLNIELSSLLQLGRLETALASLEEVVGRQDTPDSREGTKPQFAREVIQLLVGQVTAASTPALTQRLKKIFVKLDYSAEITDQTILELLLTPIDWNTTVERRPASELQSLTRRYRPKDDSWEAGGRRAGSGHQGHGRSSAV